MDGYIIFLVLCTMIIGGNCQCDSGFLRHDDSCYHFSHEEEPWISAMYICNGFNGAYLTEITSARENSFIYNQVKAPSDTYWIGGSDLLVEGEYLWHTSHTPVTFTNWAPNEPNNSGGKENCIHFLPSNGYWNDATCTGNKRFICEKPIEGSEVVG